MLDSERNSHETDANEATGHAAGTAPAPTVFNGPAEPPVPAVPAALFQPPQVLFQPPPPRPSAAQSPADDRDAGGRADSDADAGRASRRTRTSRSQAAAADDQAEPAAEA